MGLSNHSRFVLATNNQGKALEFKQMFMEAGLSLISPADLGLRLLPDETGTTYEENSLIKALETFDLLKRAGYDSYGVMADDSGFEVDALGGLPGVDSALYLGEDTSSAVRNDDIINQMKDKQNRTARFVCVITCILPNGDKFKARGEVVGEVAHAPKGLDGFGYDPIFYFPEFGKTMAELPPDKKNKLSHRSKALELLIDILRR